MRYQLFYLFQFSMSICLSILVTDQLTSLIFFTLDSLMSFFFYYIIIYHIIFFYYIRLFLVSIDLAT